MSLTEFLSRFGSQVASAALFQVCAIIFTLAFATIIGIPLGLFCYNHHRLKKNLLGIADILQTLPALGLLGLLVAVAKLNLVTTFFLVFFYTLLPIIFGAEKGFRSIDRTTIDAAIAMGIPPVKVVTRIMLPLVSPLLMQGIRTGSIACVGATTIASFNIYGLGSFIMDGIRLENSGMILAGAIPVCLMALILDIIISYFSSIIIPKALFQPEEEKYISK